MLGVGHVADAPAVVFDPVAGSTVRVVEWPRAEQDLRLRAESLGGVEILEADLGLEDLDRDRKQGCGHHMVEHAAQAGAGGEMAGPEPKAIGRIESGAE